MICRPRRAATELVCHIVVIDLLVFDSIQKEQPLVSSVVFDTITLELTSAALFFHIFAPFQARQRV